MFKLIRTDTTLDLSQKAEKGYHKKCCSRVYKLTNYVVFYLWESLVTVELRLSFIFPLAMLARIRGTCLVKNSRRAFTTCRPLLSLRLGDIAPDFEQKSTQGPIRFHKWLDGHWGILFSHPKDYTPVCTTELGYMQKILPEFKKRDVKVLALSVDSLDEHAGWIKDIEETQNIQSLECE